MEDCRLSNYKPGPGSYDPFGSISTHQGYTMSNQSKDPDRPIKTGTWKEQLSKYRKSPGPADYENMTSSF